MIHACCRVTAREHLGSNIFVVRFHSPEIASTVAPGQFVNLRVSETDFPLLRRPFSVYNTNAGEVSVLFDVRGAGTRLLASKREGDPLDVIGPLGCPYATEVGFETALLVGGGLGVAPLPMILRAVRRRGKPVATFVGARSADRAVTSHLDNPHIATDDGSLGFRGSVIDLLRHRLESDGFGKPKIFACGPTPMLSAVARLAGDTGIPCEVSLESPMACGVGICQGCPVELSGSGGGYALICRDGPVFDSQKVILV